MSKIPKQYLKWLISNGHPQSHELVWWVPGASDREVIENLIELVRGQR